MNDAAQSKIVQTVVFDCANKTAQILNVRAFAPTSIFKTLFIDKRIELI